ncbi:MAG: SpoIIE family protein phosphatase [Ignavibacteriales bacterium]|nr:SpoIIE family protein phosphatase [Ignavibacteriales bacterium]
MRRVVESRVGQIRERNEDVARFREFGDGVYAGVFDGVGGAPGGTMAANFVAEAVEAYLSDCTLDFVRADCLRDALRDANREAGKRLTARALTTATILGLREGKLAWAHAGDSRLYLLDDRLRLLTKDHTFTQLLVDAGEIDEAAARKHPQRNQLTSAVGDGDGFLSVDAGEMTAPESWRRLLLCTDGVVETATDEEIAEIVGADDLDVAARRLVDLVEDRGAPDNYTFVIIAPDDGA